MTRPESLILVMPKPSPWDLARLQACVEAIRNAVALRCSPYRCVPSSQTTGLSSPSKASVRGRKCRLSTQS